MEKLYYLRDASVEQHYYKIIAKSRLGGRNIMTTYKLKNGDLYLDELYVYGSSRLGSLLVNKKIEDLGGGLGNHTAGKKTYELNNHLGNVMMTISDAPKYMDSDGNGTTDVTTASVSSAQDYYPFGMLMPGRMFNMNTYRHGYQGQFAEKDAESGYNHFDLRDYDGRIGRWMCPDPAGQFYSSYLGMGNNPILFSDPDGGKIKWANRGTKLYVKGLMRQDKVFASKINQLKKSKINYYFQKFKFGQITDKNGDLLAGVVAEGDNGAINVFFTVTNPNPSLNPKTGKKENDMGYNSRYLGFSVDASCYEEVYHAVDYDDGLIWDLESGGTLDNETDAIFFSFSAKNDCFSSYRDINTGQSLLTLHGALSELNKTSPSLAKQTLKGLLEKGSPNNGGLWQIPGGKIVQGVKFLYKFNFTPLPKQQYKNVRFL